MAPRDYHWRISPLDRLHEQSAEGETKAMATADSVYGNPYAEVQSAIRRAAEYGSDADCDLCVSGRRTPSGSSVQDWVSSWFSRAGKDETAPAPEAAPEAAIGESPSSLSASDNTDQILDGARDDSSTQASDSWCAECIEAVADLAVVELADYIWCAQNTVGVVQPSAGALALSRSRSRVHTHRETQTH